MNKTQTPELLRMKQKSPTQNRQSNLLLWEPRPRAWRHGGMETLKTKSHSFITGDQTLDIRLTLDFLGKQKQANIVCLNGAAA